MKIDKNDFQKGSFGGFFYGILGKYGLTCLFFVFLLTEYRRVEFEGESYEEVFLDGLTVDDIRALDKNMKVHILSNIYSFEEISDIIKSLG